MPSVPRYSWLSMAVWLSHVCHFTNVRVRGKLHMQTLSPHGACSNRSRRYKCLRSTYASDIETFIVLYCIVLYCMIWYCIVLYCIVLYCIVLRCTVLYCAVLNCIVNQTDLCVLPTITHVPHQSQQDSVNLRTKTRVSKLSGSC